jgi:hypothetical protein
MDQIDQLDVVLLRASALQVSARNASVPQYQHEAEHIHGPFRLSSLLGGHIYIAMITDRIVERSA